MIRVKRVAFIGNSLPRRCGIATFTTELQQAVASVRPRLGTSIVAMNDPGHIYAYPDSVRVEIDEGRPEDYLAAAEILNSNQVDVVSLQHEFGIFGGEAGDYILPLLSRLTVPVVTTLHTVLAAPSAEQRRVMDEIVRLSARVVVMAEKGRQLLREVYDAPADKIQVIAHGIPDVPFETSDLTKLAEGYDNRKVILTFGLLSPNKGIEVMIDAMPAILKASPTAVYVVLGATHPNLVRNDGEAYRDGLKARVDALGITDSVVFLNQFVDQATLLRCISMCDVYVTPYLNEAQMTSGTLAYSFGLGRAVVSTPYWHAAELLADGAGILVPFNDRDAIGEAVSGLLTDDARRQEMSREAYRLSRSMTWEQTAGRYLKTFESVLAERSERTAEGPMAATRAATRTPEIRLDHLMAMSDDTGLIQHAVHAVPDRGHGYCVDDNARGLLLATTLEHTGDSGLPDQVAGRYAAFVQHAFNPDNGRFRNFMSFDRRWLEEVGSEDSHGRTLWALGDCARNAADPARRRWAAALFAKALPAVESFRSPRAFASTLLGLVPYRAAHPDDEAALRLQSLLCDRLMALIGALDTADWTWFEEGLAYDNARLPQALIATGLATRHGSLVRTGLGTLSWLIGMQTAPSGVFRPVGSHSFGALRQPPEPFDQQPLEAAATISACVAAWTATKNIKWKIEAERAFGWFMGANDLSIPLVDVKTGRCRDGLHPDRANENCGAESVVSYLLGLAEIRQLVRTRSAEPDDRPVVRLVPPRRPSIGSATLQ
ncbi:D-inositol-3-phosphate glycosyltransferase [Pleomorphomonas sp. T1.2MG-36]|uniref:glycosyltransferase family 4 protein n=1 Tax=Pleomorphomonas sp. T1.2MG-36 TaxID=3041167 RepID=UPI0024779A99|nr:glycosyltransferase family 4 protein [Pleomorphomonas sp. T1.2MG-36]CAI9404171.1 D-inositol-3-phosphate glycosyltransferase [Pleomorphomonas sp. T1.2MG-36]